MMGCYGIGPARIAAAAIEQLADERGIVWPVALAPWQVHVVGLGKPGDEVMAAAEKLYEELTAAGIEVVFDDRPNAGAGEKLTDAELLGCPLRLVVGKRGLKDGIAESQLRADGREENIALDGAVARVAGDPRGARVRRPGRGRAADEARADPQAACWGSTAPARSRRRPAPDSHCGRSRSRI